MNQVRGKIKQSESTLQITKFSDKRVIRYDGPDWNVGEVVLIHWLKNPFSVLFFLKKNTIILYVWVGVLIAAISDVYGMHQTLSGRDITSALYTIRRAGGKAHSFFLFFFLQIASIQNCYWSPGCCCFFFKNKKLDPPHSNMKYSLIAYLKAFFATPF